MTEHTPTTKEPRPHRPFGVGLAILLCIMIFVVVPMTLVLFFVASSNLVYQVESQALVGVEVLGVSTPAVAIAIAVAVFVLLLSVAAWFFRSEWVRRIYSFGMLAVGIGVTIWMLQSTLGARSFEQGIDSASELTRNNIIGLVLIVVLVTAFAVWMMQRWSAKAFYRGYYTTEDLERIERVYGS
ncbi:hypothetical protein G4Y79_14685 [Phototrophicus methaneseepsis]|uniref:Uncharacterized protein n=1 Tax=Phototrophicus methaneseepsis TaxID=2710758 RepID=A0A7S8ICW7_9CHLR|nr:hypothetical protein [Phototrophicus methaneseepsis]QPC80952.1 hypothetical protein G4Y79_14685 [Phototrophicus methaneseepsis]